MKIRFIYSNDINEELGSEEEIAEQYKEFCEINEIERGDKDDMEQWADETVNDYWDDEISNIKFFEAKHSSKYYLIKAKIGRWNGTFDGGLVVSGLVNTFFKIINNEDYFKIYLEGGKLKVTTSNHDASSNFYIKELTDKGREWYNNIGQYMDARECHEKLENNSHYTREVRLFKELFGY